MALAIQASSSNKDMGYAVSMFAFMRSFGQTVGVAVGGVIFQNSILKKLKTYPLLASRATELARDASSLVEVIKAMPDGLEKTQMLESYVYGLRIVWIVMTALSALALVVSVIGTKALPLDRELETEHGYVQKSKVSDAEKTTPNEQQDE